MSNLPSPELHRRSSTEQMVCQDYGPDLLLRPIVPATDYRRMAAILDLCNWTRDGGWPEGPPTGETAEYAYDRLAMAGCWGSIVTPVKQLPFDAGFVMGMPYKNKDEEIVPGSQDLRLLMVNPLFQKIKLGRLLLDWAADFNQKQGADHLLLWVQAHNERARPVLQRLIVAS